MRDKRDLEDLSKGEYAVETERLGVLNGELGRALTRRMSSDMGVDLRGMEWARNRVPDCGEAAEGGGLVR